MHITRPHCRATFTPNDLGFIAQALTREERELSAINSLMSDPASLDHILDDNDLWDALLNSTEPLKLSLELYFYVIVRRVFLTNGIKDRETADYVAAVLATKARQREDALQSMRNSPLLCTTDWSIEFENAPESYRFELLIFAAETLLVVTGLFPEHIAWREERRAAPGFNWYASKCRQGYEEAGKHRLAERYHMDHIYSDMAGSFPTILGALNKVQNAFMNFEPLPEFN